MHGLFCRILIRYYISRVSVVLLFRKKFESGGHAVFVLNVLLNVFSMENTIDGISQVMRQIRELICGTADMPLKNYSLLETAEGMRLSPAYDFVSAALVLPDDPEESALTINGKKTDFLKRIFYFFALPD